MKNYLVAALFLATVGTAHAQQPQQPTMVQQLMTNDANIKAALADQLDKANVQIAALNVQISALKTENEALKKSQNKPTEPKKPEVKKP